MHGCVLAKYWSFLAHWLWSKKIFGFFIMVLRCADAHHGHNLFLQILLITGLLLLVPPIAVGGAIKRKEKNALLVFIPRWRWSVPGLKGIVLGALVIVLIRNSQADLLLSL